MIWIKGGLIFSPSKNYDWMQTHAALPIPLHLHDDYFRIYFSSRNNQNIASIGFLELDITKPQSVNHISKNPVLSPGNRDSFDHNGVMAHSIVPFQDKLYMYYTGWKLGNNQPFTWEIGLAISNNNGESFEKYSTIPILARSKVDPVFVASPTVLYDENKWKMWYISGLGWKESEGVISSPYHICYAESDDGISWLRKGIVCITFQNDSETRIGRASIIKEDGLYKMWYSYALESYRIGYAESDNGITWKRKDNFSGINVSNSGWDSMMIEYPFVFEHNQKKYMLYNGNDYGKTGFGYATLNID